MMMFGGGGCAAPGRRHRRRRDCFGRPRPAARTGRAIAPATEQLIADGWGFASLNPAQHPGRQRRRADEGHHRPGQQGPAAQAGRLGRAARLGVGRVARARLSRDRHGGRREAGRHRRRVALRQGGARDDGVRPALRGRAGRLVGRRRRQAAPPQLRARRSRTSPARGEYHWMAGNFLKYGAAEATFGSKNAGDLPVDAHELIALCAPRLTFISYGVPEKGDAKWLDQQGSFMAAVAAQPVFRLLGAKDLGRSRRLHDREDAGGERQPARRPARLAAARRRPHRRPELEVLHPVGRPDARADTGARGAFGAVGATRRAAPASGRRGRRGGPGLPPRPGR